MVSIFASTLRAIRSEILRSSSPKIRMRTGILVHLRSSVNFCSKFGSRVGQSRMETRSSLPWDFFAFKEKAGSGLTWISFFMPSFLSSRADCSSRTEIFANLLNSHLTMRLRRIGPMPWRKQIMSLRIRIAGRIWMPEIQIVLGSSSVKSVPPPNKIRSACQ